MGTIVSKRDNWLLDFKLASTWRFFLLFSSLLCDFAEKWNQITFLTPSLISVCWSWPCLAFDQAFYVCSWYFLFSGHMVCQICSLRKDIKTATSAQKQLEKYPHQTIWKNRWNFHFFRNFFTTQYLMPSNSDATFFFILFH